MAEYDQFVDHVVEAGVGSNKMKMWNATNLKAISNEYKPMFAAKGVDIFFSHKQEYISHGKSGHYEYYRWIEFVDREEQPSYHPQYDAETKKQKGFGDGCSIM